MSRDLRIDFLRGLVLLWIVADHVYYNDTRWFVTNDWLFFDCAAGFVFMSGLVCGMVHWRALQRCGWLTAQVKALRRCGQLYLGQIAGFAAVVGLLALVRMWQPVDVGEFGLDAVFARPMEAVPKALLLAYTPWLLDILKLYIVLLLVLPSLLWLYARWRLGAIAMSVAIYCFAQRYPEISPREYPHGLPWFWNPLGWQILFVVAAALGLERARGTLRIPRHPLLVTLACVMMLGIVVLARTHLLHWGWTDRQRLAPAHVISFFVFAYLLSGLLKPGWKFWSSAIAKPVVICGQHSLVVFCCSIVIGYALSLFLLPIHNGAIEAGIIASGIVATVLVGLAMHHITLWRKAKPQVPASAMVASPSSAMFTTAMAGPNVPLLLHERPPANDAMSPLVPVPEVAPSQPTQPYEPALSS